jgi:predicted O-linked N-acetylglucosamine transferase (SPINDLY family)
MQHHQAGRLAEATAEYRQALAHDPSHAEALHLLGLLAHQLGRPESAVELIGRAITSAADRPGYHLNLGVVLQALGRLDEAIAAYRQAITLQPDSATALNNLGIALQLRGSLAEAIPCFERAIALQPDFADAHYNLGVARQTEGRDDLAVACYRAALAVRPNYLGAQYNLGYALQQLRQFREAATSYRAVLTLEPTHLDTLNYLGVVLYELGELDEALTCFERAIELQPAYPHAFTNLGRVMSDRGRLDEALQAYRRSIALRPDEQVHSGVIFTLDHHPTATLEMAFAERRAWNAAHAAALTVAAPAHANRPDPERTLRVGYVSGDFRNHSASTTFSPILAHDPGQVEVVCYADVARPDDRTTVFSSQVPHWRNIAGWTDAALAEQVRADRIDILVDLAGHSGRHRLLAFARKPAPVQVTAWGYATSTGLDAMDAFLVDPVVAPPEDQRWYAEELVQLPSVVCIEPMAALPDVVPAPCIERGALTFGSFNGAHKLSPMVLDTWATIVAAVPGSRMVLKGLGLDDPENRARILAAFATHGVEPERVDVLGATSRHEHLRSYGSVDIQLDSFPSGGGVTTFEGLMMGVPCVTVLGDRIAGRISASFLTVLGYSDLVGSTPAAYITIATGLAERTEWLASQRCTLRERVLASPIGNPALYTRYVEDAYRTLWRRWCAEQSAVSNHQPSGVAPVASSPLSR